MAGASAARVSDASAQQDAIARRAPHIVAEGDLGHAGDRSATTAWSKP